MTDIAVPADSNISKKEYEKVEKDQELREQLEQMFMVQSKVVSVVKGELETVTPKLKDWLQNVSGTAAVDAAMSLVEEGTQSPVFFRFSCEQMDFCFMFALGLLT